MKINEKRPKRKGAKKKRESKPAPEERTVEQTVEDIRDTSSKRPVRVVIDEVYPGGFYRVLTAEMKTRKKEPDDADPSVWGDEVEHYMDERQLQRLLAGTGSKEVWEGKVYRLKGKRSKDINEDVRKRVSRDYKALLVREGRRFDAKRRRW
jgi:hypothetical protein